MLETAITDIEIFLNVSSGWVQSQNVNAQVPNLPEYNKNLSLLLKDLVGY